MSSKPSYPATGSLSLRQAPPHRSTGASSHRRKPSGPFSAVPFSWEHRPGIPKSPVSSLTPSPTHPLLLPPLRSAAAVNGGSKYKKRPAGARRNIKKRAAGGESASHDPFVAALAECAKEPPLPDLDELFPRRAPTATASSWSISRRFGLYDSCKTTCAVSDSTVRVAGLRIRTGGEHRLGSLRALEPPVGLNQNQI